MRVWAGWRRPLVLVQPQTVIAWQRKGWRLWWRFKSKPKETGRPRVPWEVIELIKRISREDNPAKPPRRNGGHRLPDRADGALASWFRRGFE